MNKTNRFWNRSVLGWIARILSLISAGMLLAFLFGGNERPPNLNEIAGLIFFPGGILLGMALGWRHEIFGGVVTVSSLMGFYIWHYAAGGNLPSGPYFLIFALPGILFLVAGCLRRIQTKPITKKENGNANAFG